MNKQPQRNGGLNLSNWRQPSNQRWAFHHVREIIPSERIACGGIAAALPRVDDERIASMVVAGRDGVDWSMQQWLDASSTDALLIARRGELVQEWYAHDAVETCPHIVFSVSKSITAALTGILVGQGVIDPSRLLTDYIPELSASGYRGASLQQLLDMVVNIEFDEIYDAVDGKFIEYRTATGWHPCDKAAIDCNLHDFLCSLEYGSGEHGRVFEYKSPNSDLLGWILERAGGERFADLISRHLWRPMGCEADAYVTVDRKGAPRTAGGICALPRDLLRFGETMRNRGKANGRQVIHPDWVDDCRFGGNQAPWLASDSSERFPRGKYRNKWYQSGNQHGAMLAIGIHSQWIYIDPEAEVTIVKLSSQEEPLNADLGAINLAVFAAICDLS